MHALDYKDKKHVSKVVQPAACTKDGTLTWDEYLDTFLLREQDKSMFMDRVPGTDWWQKIDADGNEII